MSALSSTLPSPLPTRPETPLATDPRAIVSPEQITAQLALLAKRESDITLSLNALVSDRSSIDNAISHLQSLGEDVYNLSLDVDGAGPSGGLGLTNGDAVDGYDEGGLVERVRRVWETSERVGGKVRRLDEEVGRVREATDIVTEVLELKTLTSSIAKNDWESASRACRRAMDVRKEVIEGGFAGAVVPTPQQPQPPNQLLEELRDILLHTFRTEFDAAAEKKDEQAVSRFFRLWPGIGAEREGLEAYGDFVVGLVKARNANSGKPSNTLYYLTSLTSLLESIAHIIDQHQPVVDKYYGAGHMGTVVGRLVAESDRVVRNLVEGWEEERRVGRLISETRQSRFTLLSTPQLFPPLFASLHTSSNQLSLSAIATSTTSHLSSASNLLQSYAPGAKRPQGTASPAPPAIEEDQGPDSRDVDRILGELVALGGRWALFRRFVWGRIASDDDDDDEMERVQATDDDATEQRPPVNGSGNGDAIAGSAEVAAPKAKMDNELEVVEQSGSQKAIENLLKVYYEPLEVWFLRTSIEKAHRLDSPDTSSRPYLSSILDDTFYLLKQVLNRAMSCGSLNTLKSMREKLVTVVENDYLGVIKKKMESVYSVPIGAQDRGIEKERREKEQRQAFIIYLNDLDISADYMDRLIEETLVHLPQVFIEREIAAVREEMVKLNGLSERFRASGKNGLEQLFNQLTKPRLRGLLDDCYRDVEYDLDEDAFALAEEDDLVRKRFIRAWEGLVDGYKDAFTDHNYQTFFAMTVETLVRPWEKMIMNMRFSELGAIRFERDVRSIANYLSTQTTFGGAREKFTRLQQIATVLNLDDDEDTEDFYSNSGIPWRISKNEYNAVVEQRR